MQNIKNKLWYYILDDKKFYSRFLLLTVPIVLQNFMASTLNLIDNFMIGKLHQINLTAVSQANQVFTVLTFILMGLSGGVAIFTAQFWSAGNLKNIKKTITMAVIISVVISGAFTIGAFFIPEKLIAVFTKDVAVMDLGVKYLRIIAFSYVLTALTFVYSAALRSCGKVKLPMYASAVAILINVVLNYVLIFGKFGAPALGVEGAAIATLTARIVESLMIMTYTFKVKKFLWCKKTEVLAQKTSAIILKFIRISFPVIANEAIWGLGATMFAVVFGRMGTDAYSSYTISGTVERMAWVLALGVGSACAVIIGQELGVSKKEKAYQYAVRCCIISMSFAVVIATLICLLSNTIVNIYEFDQYILDDAKKMIFVFASVFIFKSFNYTTICGVFRAGGDTKYSMVVDIAGIWVVSVPMLLIFGSYLNFPIHIVYLIANANEIINFGINSVHLVRKKWMRNINNEL